MNNERNLNEINEPNVNTLIEPKRMSTIEDAIRNGSNVMFNYWYKHGSSYDEFDLLQIACESGNRYVASKLFRYLDTRKDLEFVIDPIDCILEQGERTILMWFAKWNWSSLIEELIGLHRDYLHAKEYETGFTALHIAVEHDNHESVQALLGLGVNPLVGTVYADARWEELRDNIDIPDFYEDLPLDEQILYQDFLEQYYDEFANNNSELIYGYVAELDNFSEEFFDIYIEDHIIQNIVPIMLAKSLKMVKLLYNDDSLSCLDSVGNDLLNYAMMGKNANIIEFILRKRAPYEVVTDSKPECCPICYLDTDANIVKTRCGHYFHETCLTKWLMIKSNCPMCRTEFF